MTDILESAIATICFGARRRDGFSVPVSPEECAALLLRIESSVVVRVVEDVPVMPIGDEEEAEESWGAV